MADLKSLEAQFDAAIGRVQADLNKLRGQLEASQKTATTISPEDQAIIDRLEVKAAALDPTDPTTINDVPEATPPAGTGQ